MLVFNYRNAIQDNDNHQLLGWHPYHPAIGLHDKRNVLVAFQIEDSIEIWETSLLYGDTRQGQEQTIKEMLNWFADVEYCEPQNLVRWFVLDIRFGFKWSTFSTECPQDTIDWPCFGN